MKQRQLELPIPRVAAKKSASSLIQKLIQAVALGALSLSAGIASAAESKATETTDTLATVGGKVITAKEFNDEYSELVKISPSVPTKEVFLEDMIRYKMGLQEADKKKTAEDPIVKRRIDQEIYKGLIEKELGKKIADIKVNENEMQEFYKKNPEIRTSHILIEFRADATAEQKTAAKDRAKEILDNVQKGKRSFEEYVALYTDDVMSKKTGGDVGWQTSATLVPPYYQAALAMKVNDVKGLVETQYGFHIIKKTGVHPYAEANKRGIRTAVYDQKRAAIVDAYFVALKKQYPIKVNKDKLK